MRIYLRAQIIDNLGNMFNSFRALSIYGMISAVIEILMLAMGIYYIFMWAKNTKARTLFSGFLSIIIIIIIAEVFEFQVILYIIRSVALFAAIALIVIFQEDIRNGIENLGRQRFFQRLLPDLNKFTKKTSEDIVSEIAEASFAMAKVRTGALMVIERGVALPEIEKTGIAINGDITKQLIINIFEKNTPLHDGAVLIVGDKIKSATCYLPLSHNPTISKDLGTRHRAALGISEVSDSITIVVSEQTGNVSICVNGKIIHAEDERTFVSLLINEMYKGENGNTKKKSIN